MLRVCKGHKLHRGEGCVCVCRLDSSHPLPMSRLLVLLINVCLINQGPDTDTYRSPLTFPHPLRLLPVTSAFKSHSSPIHAHLLRISPVKFISATYTSHILFISSSPISPFSITLVFDFHPQPF